MQNSKSLFFIFFFVWQSRIDGVDGQEGGTQLNKKTA